MIDEHKPKIEIVRVELKKYDADGNLIETITKEFPNGTDDNRDTGYRVPAG